MTSYLLLRNNKESGPFTLDELVSKGLKAYDLIWVKGKSAAWRYPGEIPELIQFAPPVEEQPYDRFYKKSTETTEQKPEPVVQSAPVRNSQPVETAPPAEPVTTPVQSIPPTEVPIVAPVTENIKETRKEIAPENTPEKEPETISSPYIPAAAAASSTAFVPKKSVFVTMPKGQRPPDPVPAHAQASTPAYQKYQPAPEQVLQDEKPTISIKENPVAAEVKYSQPLDEIKEMYVKTLQERKQRIANKAFIVQVVKKVAIVVGIVGAGILIGLSINSGGAKKLVASESRDQALLAQHSLPVNSEVNDAIDPVDNKPSEGTLLSKTENSYQPVENVPTYPERTVAKKRIANEEPVTRDEEEVLTGKETPAREQLFDEEAEAPAVEVDQQTGERNKKVRDETELPVTQQDEVKTETKEPARKTARPIANNKSLASQVSVKTNNYKIVAFGGIRDLHVTVNNDSKYILDKVLVELQYLKPNMEPFRVDVITFRSVSPNGSLTIRMPDTNRGIKVRYKIMNILSTQSAKDMADL